MTEPILGWSFGLGTVRCMIIGICGNAISQRDGVWHTHHSFGRIVELMAERGHRIHYHAPRAIPSAAGACDYPLSHSNITVYPWPVRRNSLHALRRPDLLLRGYREAVKDCDALFLRGSGPLIWTAHRFARRARVGVVHWVVTNPSAVLRGERSRYGRITQWLGILFADFERFMLRRAMRCSNAHVLANGEELVREYQGPRTIPVISTSITRDDIIVRTDTCEGEIIRLLFVGFIRPEKGIEYLLRAMPLIRTSRALSLTIVGPWNQFPREHQRLCDLTRQLGLNDSVNWAGYRSFGEPLFQEMDRADVLVLPTLSEGTPRVLVESRARSLPLVSTNVGGIPDSVTDGYDGLLVPPRDPQSLADSISRVINDGELRRGMIRAGRDRVRQWTVDRFVDLVLERLSHAAAEARSK